jgi:hypothetical protein
MILYQRSQLENTKRRFAYIVGKMSYINIERDTYMEIDRSLYLFLLNSLQIPFFCYFAEPAVSLNH